MEPPPPKHWRGKLKRPIYWHFVKQKINQHSAYRQDYEHALENEGG